MIMMVIIAPIIIIIIIVGMSIPNTQSRPKNAVGNHRKKTRTHTMPQAGRRETTPSRPTGPHHATPQGGGPHHREEPMGGGGDGRTGIIYIYIYETFDHQTEAASLKSLACFCQCLAHPCLGGRKLVRGAENHGESASQRRSALPSGIWG